jgi:hypothetical protein
VFWLSVVIEIFYKSQGVRSSAAAVISLSLFVSNLVIYGTPSFNPA